MNFEEFKERFQKIPVEEYPNRVRETIPEPMVSVRITTYQHADFIRESIESVLMQETDFPVEILIGDDESTDGTREICIEYAEKHPERIRLMLHRRENNIHLHGGPTHLFQYAYNTFSLRGKYIAGLSGDDYWTDPLKLQKQVDFLESNPDYVASCHDARVVNSSGHITNESLLSEELKRDRTQKEVLTGTRIQPLSLCYRNILDSFPHEFFESLNEDVFIISLLGQCGKAKYHEDIEKAAYRFHEGGVYSMKTGVFRNEASSNTRYKLSQYYERIGNEKASDEFKRQALRWEEGLAAQMKAAKDYSGAVKKIIWILFSYIKMGDWSRVKLLSQKIVDRIRI